MKKDFSEAFLEHILTHDRPFTMVMSEYINWKLNIYTKRSTTSNDIAHMVQVREGGIKYVYMQFEEKGSSGFERFHTDTAVAIVVDKDLLGTQEDKVYITSWGHLSELNVPNTETFSPAEVRNVCINRYMDEYMNKLDVSNITLSNPTMKRLQQDVDYCALTGKNPDEVMRFKPDPHRIPATNSEMLDVLLHPEREKEIFYESIENFPYTKDYLMQLKAKTIKFKLLYAEACKNLAQDWRLDLLKALQGLGERSKTVVVEYTNEGKTEKVAMYITPLTNIICKGTKISIRDLVKRQEWPADIMPWIDDFVNRIVSVSYRNNEIWRKA